MTGIGGAPPSFGGAQTTLQHERGPLRPQLSPPFEQSLFDVSDLSPDPPSDSPTKEDFSADSSLPLRHAHETRYDFKPASEMHSFTASVTRPKPRPRGASDLGRPGTRLNTTQSNGRPRDYGFPPVGQTEQSALATLRSSAPTLPDWSSNLILTLPYLLASIADMFPERRQTLSLPAFVQASALASGTLLLAGGLGQILTTPPPLDKRKPIVPVASRSSAIADGRLEVEDMTKIPIRMLGVFLPYFAAALLGGPRTALILILLTGSSLWGTGLKASSTRLSAAIQDNYFTCGALALAFLFDFVGVTSTASAGAVSVAYAVLITCAIFPPGPFSLARPRTSQTASSAATSAVPSTPIVMSPVAQPPMTMTLHEGDAKITLLSGISLSIITFFTYTLLSIKPAFTFLTIALLLGSVAFSLILISTPQPPAGQKVRIPALAVAMAPISLCSSWTPASQSALSIGGSLVRQSLVLLGGVAVTADRGALSAKSKHTSPPKDSLRASPPSSELSALSTFILQYLTPGSIIHTIMLEKDSRRIAYFASLNLGFMMVQLFYGFVSGSLGLLTDSIHMLFDCAGLAVGLTAAVMSKWPPSMRFPYGYSKIDTLSGFANGIFLILVSVEIVFDAVHRLGEGHEMHRLNELLVVSILGFLVNIIGLTAFGHAHHHHGHGDGHGHGHNHEHSHSHNHSHSHHHGHHHSHGHSRSDDKDRYDSTSFLSTDGISASHLFANTPGASPPTVQSHSHQNENMQGIFLHILADALGSLAVIISTLLTQYTGWHGWDPLASCLISLLIFGSAVPLVKAAGMRLLLALPDEVEYSVRSALGELGGLRGVSGYQVPKFWMAEAADKHSETTMGHGHIHSHSHDHTPEPSQAVRGVIHISAAHSADLDDVRERVGQFLKSRGIDAVVHVDREGDGRCWCRGGLKAG